MSHFFSFYLHFILKLSQSELLPVVGSPTEAQCPSALQTPISPAQQHGPRRLCVFTLLVLHDVRFMHGVWWVSAGSG